MSSRNLTSQPRSGSPPHVPAQPSKKGALDWEGEREQISWRHPLPAMWWELREALHEAKDRTADAQKTTETLRAFVVEKDKLHVREIERAQKEVGELREKRAQEQNQYESSIVRVERECGELRDKLKAEHYAHKAAQDREEAMTQDARNKMMEEHQQYQASTEQWTLALKNLQGALDKANAESQKRLAVKDADYDKLRDQNQKLCRELQSKLDKQELALRAEVQRSQKDLEQVRSLTAAAESQHRAEVSKLDAMNRELSSKLKIVDEEHRVAWQKVQTGLEQANSDLAKKDAETARLLATKDARHRAEADQAKKEIDALHRLLLDRQDEHDAFVVRSTQTIESMRVTIHANLEEKERAARKSREDLSALRALTTAEKTALQAELQQTQADLLDARRRLTGAEAESHIAKREREEALARLAQQEEEHKAALARMQKEYNDMKRTYEAKIAELQKELQKLQKENAELRAALSAKEIELQEALLRLKNQQQQAAIDAQKWKAAALDCANVAGGKPANPSDPATVVESVKAEVKELKFQLEEALRAQREYIPWIGFEVSETGFVKSIQRGGAAAEAGIQDGDKCLKVGSVDISNLDEFRAAIRGNVRPGMTVPFTLLRGASMDVMVANVYVRCISMKDGGTKGSMASPTSDAAWARTRTTSLVNPKRF